MDGITCKFVRPDRQLFEGEVASVVLVTPTGELGVWPLHDPEIISLGYGVVRLNLLERDGGGTVKVIVSGGYAEVGPDHVILLADHACRADRIEEDVVRETRAQAEHNLALLDEEDSRRAYYESKIHWFDTLLGNAIADVIEE